MSSVIAECHRCLHTGCRMVINVGDQFCSKAEHGVYHCRPIGADLTVAAIDAGFLFMGDIIWRKTPNGKASGGAKLAGSLYYPRDGALNIAYEHILIFKKNGEKPVVTAEQIANSRLEHDERTKWFTGIWNDITPERQSVHPAMYPIEVPMRAIKMFSFWGETVLDPFIGSGTTSKAALMLGRSSIGYEINDRMEQTIKEKVFGMMPNLFDEELEFTTRHA